MRVINEMKLLFTSLSVNESFGRSAVSSFLLQLDPTIAELNEIRTALSEAITNSVVHAYKDIEGIIEINTKIYDNRTVYIRVKDKGCGIINISQAMEAMYTTAPNEERSGLGFSVMLQFMDKVQVSSKPKQGTTVTMTKRLSDNSRVSK
ncbi:MAG: anti-sigma F factor [Oscillospiraceae bacterium]|jgi:stage II sporulation protein AB (anti-sigma F factor)|nr:anti-sigma F factor [Oscillospiraceae bacterium]